jgi:hypothetical protein
MMKHLINVLSRSARYCPVCCIFSFLAVGAEHLSAQNSLAANSDVIIAVDKPVRADVLANDRLGPCDRSSVTLDTLAGNRLRFVTLSINPDNTFTCTPLADGVDIVTYSVTCGTQTVRAELHIVAVKSLAAKYLACSGVKFGVSLPVIKDVGYSMYEPGDPSPIRPNPDGVFENLKDNSSSQKYYFNVRYNGNTLTPKPEISVDLNRHCGVTDPPDCPKNGQILFLEDFGGNSYSDPSVKPEGISQVQGFDYSQILNRPGQYVISKQSPGFYLEWYKIDDHTYPGDLSRGYLMAVEGTSAKWQIYEHRIDGLCSDTKLYFSAWVVSLMKPATKDKARLTFLVEGVRGNLLARYQTNNIKDFDPKWKSYGFDFVVPPGETSVILRIINGGDGKFTSSPSGNDYAIDDIGVHLCVPPVVTENPATDSVCYSKPFTYKASYTDDGTFFGYNSEMITRFEYSRTKDFANPVLLKADTVKSPKVDFEYSIASVSESDYGYYRLTVGNKRTIDYASSNAMSHPVLLQVDTVNAVDDVAITLFGKPIVINVLENDFLKCVEDPDALTLDTLAGSGLKYGSLKVNPDKTFTYTPSGDKSGVDTVMYRIRHVVGGRVFTDTAMVFINVIKYLSVYTACPGTDVRVSMKQVNGIGYFWYDRASGGKALNASPSNSVTVTKDSSDIQTVYVEAVYSGIVSGRREEIKLFAASHCGTGIPPDCAKNGRALFSEDFGGNSAYDPPVKSRGIPQVDGYKYNTLLNTQGSYVIARTNPQAHPATWYVISDHTSPGDASRGYMLSIDATVDPGQFYVHRIDGLCAGTKLYFSTWIVSLLKVQLEHKANLIFTVEDLNGNMLAQYYTGNIPDVDPAWKSYGFEFTVPEGESSVVLRIINNGSGSSGNDLAIDDIEIRFCSPEVALDSPQADTVCYGSPYTFKASYTDDGSFTAQNNELIAILEYSRTPGFDTVAVVAADTVAASTMDIRFDIGRISETNAGYYRIAVGNRQTVGRHNCRAESKVITLNVETARAADDVALTVFNRPLDIDVLANDNPLCTRDRSLLTVDTVAGRGFRFGSLRINPDKTVTYIPKGNVSAVDSTDYILTYSVDGKKFTDTATIRVAVLKPLSANTVLCPQTQHVIGMHAVPDVEYFWYNAPSGGSLLMNSPANAVKITKDNTPEQSWYIEPVFKKIRFPIRYRLAVLKSDNCGTVSPSGCAAENDPFFREDFGGNGAGDKTVGTSALPQGVTDYKFVATDNLKSGEYALVKTNRAKANTVWQTGFSDRTHAGDITRGYLMMLDAATSKGKICEYKITGLCDNLSRLYFSAWAANPVIRESKQSVGDPVLKFELTDGYGNILATYITSPVPRDVNGAMKWRYYGFPFDSKGYDSVILKIYSNAPNTSNVVIDDVEVRFCVPHVTVENSRPGVVCLGAPFTLKAEYDDDGTFSGTGNALSYRWEYSADGVSWTSAGVDTLAASNSVRSQYAVGKARHSDGGYYRALVGNAGTLDSPMCRTVSNTLYCEVVSVPKSSDLRITVAPTARQSTVYLSSFLDTSDALSSIKWTKATAYAPDFVNDSTGALNMAGLIHRVYTYKYTVTTKCGSSSAKAYLLVSDRNAPSHNREIYICKDLESSEHVQLNQIMGLGNDGRWTYPNDTRGTVKGNVTTASPKYAGAMIFNARQAYADAVQTSSYAVPGKPDIRAFKFRFTAVTGKVCEFTILVGK